MPASLAGEHSFPSAPSKSAVLITETPFIDTVIPTVVPTGIRVISSAYALGSTAKIINNKRNSVRKVFAVCVPYFLFICASYQNLPLTVKIAEERA